MTQSQHLDQCCAGSNLVRNIIILEIVDSYGPKIILNHGTLKNMTLFKKRVTLAGGVKNKKREEGQFFPQKWMGNGRPKKWWVVDSHELGKIKDIPEDNEK